MSVSQTLGSHPSLLEMPTPPVLTEQTSPARDTPAALVKPRRKPEPAWKRYDHLIHDGPAYFAALRKDRLAQARAARQEKVRQAALSLFAARGVAATSLARLAWQMELSPASLRRAYPDKATLLAAILEEHANALLEAVGTAEEQAIAAAAAPRARLSAMAAAALAYLAGEGAEALRIAPEAEALLEPAARDALAAKRRWLAALFASVIEQALPGLGARGGEPPARALLAMLEAAAGWSDAERGDQDLAAYAARAVAGVLAMAAPPPEDGSGKPRDQGADAAPEPPPGPESGRTAAETPHSPQHASAMPDASAAHAAGLSTQLCCPRRRRGALPAPRAPCKAKAPTEKIRGSEARFRHRSGRGKWLGREDSNLRMAEPKSAALPLGYAPSGWHARNALLAGRLTAPSRVCLIKRLGVAV